MTIVDKEKKNMSGSNTSIPIIDIGPYLDGTNKEGVAKSIATACEDIGFFMIQGHGINTEFLQSIENEAKNFFDLPGNEKSKSKAPFGLGYLGPEDDNVAATLKGDETSAAVKDTKESLNLTLPVRDGVWPRESSPTLVRISEEYYKNVLELANHLMRLFALALDLDEHFFDDKVNNAYTTLRILNYPPSSSNSEEGKVGIAEHTDYGTLTILWSSDSRGLQAKTRQDQWIDVIAPSDHFIINIGDLMMNWTNDKWISTLHRVIQHPDTIGKRRMSIPFFHNPNPDALIECLPGCYEDSTKENSSKRPKKYEPIIAKSHLERKVSLMLGKTEKLEEDKIVSRT